MKTVRYCRRAVEDRRVPSPDAGGARVTAPVNADYEPTEAGRGDAHRLNAAATSSGRTGFVR